MPLNHSLLSLPIARAAYSDRTAWLMAEMSRLAYEKFESDEDSVSQLVEKLAALSDKERIKNEILSFIKDVLEPRGLGLDTIKNTLTDAQFNLVKTFNSGGTQAFLTKRESDRMAVLAFRGTEKDFHDIKTDLKARFYTRGGVKVHDGFRQAFEYVKAPIESQIAALSDYKVYITGHSLGGALALMAARSLSADYIAACYTFGSPRVGNLEFGDVIKVPIYRIVNAADVVPRVPFSWGIDVIIMLARLIPLPYLRDWLPRFLENFRGYRHHGDMRYISASDDAFNDLRIIANPDLIDRAAWMIQRLLTDWKAGFGDHAIARYCAKLEAYALKKL